MLFKRKHAPAPAPSGDISTGDAPAFTDLDEREARFVVEYVARSGTPGMAGDAALAAGYSNNDRNAARSMASRLLRRPEVLRAIKDETGRRIAAAAPLGIAVLESLAQSARSEQVRLAAANSLVDRGYGPVISRSASVNVNADGGIEALIDRLDREGTRPDSSGRFRNASGQTIDVTPSEPPEAE